MTLQYNLTNRTPFKDAAFGPDMLLKGKLKLLPNKIKNSKRVKEIFEKSKAFEEREQEKKDHH